MSEGGRRENGIDRPSYEDLQTRVAQLEAELESSRRERGCVTVDCEGDFISPLLRQTLNNIPDLIWVKGVDKRFHFANRAACEILYQCDSPEDVIGKDDLYFASREREAGHEHTFGELCLDSDEVVLKTGQPGRFREFGKVRGQELILDVTKSPLVAADGQVIGTVGCARDITKVEKTELALKNASTFIRDLSDEIDSIAVQGYDEERFVTVWNKASEIVYGYSKEEALGKRLEDLIIPEEMKEVVIRAHHRWLNYGEKIPSGELTLCNKWGDPVQVFSSHILKETSYGKEMFCIDIDLAPLKEVEEKRRLLELQLRQAQKMEAIGVLAGGIAHDFNNILAVIFGYSDVALEKCRDSPSISRDLKQILQAAERAKSLVGQILDFSRERDVDVVPVVPGLVVKEALKMLRSSLPSSIRIESNIETETGFVLADPTQIHQLCMNLCTNAYQAMDEDGGVLSVNVRKVDGIPDARDAFTEPLADSYIHFTFTDTGPGMTPEVKEKIFDPYFTTKDIGEGTGLGLSIVHGIVKSMHGFIKCSSTVGEGTSFDIFLPRVDEHQGAAREEPQGLENPGGKESILFIDDEEKLGMLISALLEPLGYKVQVHTRAIEALAEFCGDPEGYDLVLSDYTMPEKNGLELARDIHKIRQDVPVVICTGNHSVTDEEEMRLAGVVEIAHKPLAGRELAQLVRRVLG